MPENDEYMRISKVLQANKNKSFVKRIMERDRFPTLDLGNGNHATHKMSWVETQDARGNKEYHVFPTVLWDGKALKDYGNAAYDMVRQTGNYITFTSPEDADWFSKRYKIYWDR